MERKIDFLADRSDQSYLDEIRRVAKLLKKESLTKKEFSKHGLVTAEPIARRFGGWNIALEKAGLKTSVERNISEDDLFAEIDRLWKMLGHRSSYAEFSKHAKYSESPLRKRFGSYLKAIEAFCLSRNNQRQTEQSSSTILSSPEVKTTTYKKTSEQFYGEPINFRGFRHAPINEQGVVFLFGMVSRELGFFIEAVQQGFPDCEGKYLHDKQKNIWARARIEFEYKASNFQKHGHDASKCDFIVCWEDDWPDCPISVIELKSELPSLPND